MLSIALKPIKTDKNRFDDSSEDIESTDYVPDDAINQMHRYRDAIIYAHRKDELHRPVIGAYCLYPGFFDQSKDKNPHEDEIKNIGIGAFAHLPGDNGSLWLKEFFQDKLGDSLLHLAVSRFLDDQ